MQTQVNWVQSDSETILPTSQCSLILKLFFSGKWYVLQSAFISIFVIRICKYFFTVWPVFFQVSMVERTYCTGPTLQRFTLFILHFIIYLHVSVIYAL